MWTRQRIFYIAIRALLPPLNFTMGYYVGGGSYAVAIGCLVAYLGLQGIGDYTFWNLTDRTQQETRHRLEAKLGVRK